MAKAELNCEQHKDKCREKQQELTQLKQQLEDLQEQTGTLRALKGDVDDRCDSQATTIDAMQARINALEV